jgi:phenylpropionate dioxygenase-like ring-hydroxylating dioxygenase large terminal subunit
MDDASHAPSRLQGTAYGRQQQHSNSLLTEVGPGTPCGEYLRRFWQPVLRSENFTNRPREVRILGEDLIAFRDGNGKPGLLYPRCMHRGTSLFWGHVEPDGIRCCYHGWKFDVEGNCLEQPCEPQGGLRKDAARQPWYPVREQYGLVWAYMGPPDKMPVLPQFDCLELEDGEVYWTCDVAMNAHGDLNGPEIVNYNWLHMNDNVMDPFHVQVLHTTFSGTQFVREFAVMPKVDFQPIEEGVIYKAYRKFEDGREMDRISTWMAPNAMSVPSIMMTPGRSDMMSWSVPVDDTHTRFVTVMRIKPGVNIFDGSGLSQQKPWTQMSVEERQDRPGDYEAQAGQGEISLHSEEHLVTSDRGIVMQRRLLERDIKGVMDGKDPTGVTFDPAKALVHVPSGNFYR